LVGSKKSETERHPETQSFGGIKMMRREREGSTNKPTNQNQKTKRKIAATINLSTIIKCCCREEKREMNFKKKKKNKHS
jgi:hypothetical protein